MIYLSQFLCIWRPLKISPLKGENTRPGHSSTIVHNFTTIELCVNVQKRTHSVWWVKVMGHADKEVKDELMMQT